MLLKAISGYTKTWHANCKLHLAYKTIMEAGEINFFIITALLVVTICAWELGSNWERKEK
jgi:hypothetical protein